MGLTFGAQLGPYTVTSPIGKGGMGEVWKARDTRLGRDVALKVLPDAFARDQDRLARFEREARLLASLNHANIASIYGLEQSDGAQVLVLELVEGETLADRLVRGPIPVQEAVKLALQIAEALEAAHDKGIVHRDLKPANVKVTPAGKVKVLDFGLAKLAEASGPGAQASAPDLTHSPTLSLAATQQGIILGTAAYMSPEQASGAQTDARTDVWSFGVVLFEMLTGRQLFDGKSVSHILADVLRTHPDWSRLPSHLHPRLRLLLERCLEKEARDRAHHIADVRVDLQKVLADPAGLFVRPSAAGTSVAPRSRLLALTATAVVAAVIAGVAAWILKPSEPKQVVRFAHELPSPRQFTANTPLLAVSPDGRRIVYNTDGGLYLLSVDALDARLIPGTGQGLGNVMFSPDGEWLAFITATGQLQKMPVAGGAPVPLASQPAGAGQFVGASWTVPDRIILGLGESVLSFPANGSTPEVLFKVEGGQAVLPELLPDARTVLFTLAGPQGTQVAVHSLDSGNTKELFPGTRPHYVSSGHIVYVSQNSLFARPFDLATLAPQGSSVPLVEGVLVSGVPQYAVSASGSLVYASASRSPERTIGIASVDSVTPLDLDPGLYSSPRVSPDGTRLVMQTSPIGAPPILSPAARIWVYDLNGKTAIRPLTQQGKNFHPIWTPPDGKRVTFASDRDGTMSIYWQPADGSGTPERLTTAEKGTQHFPDSWSPDGRTLVYQVFSTTETVDLWTMSLDSRDKPVPLTKGTGRNHGAVFSPKGEWLAYGSNEGSQIEQIYVEPIPRIPGVRYTITESEGAFPVWSPDGRSLFFRRVPRGAEGTGTHLVQVEIVPGSTFAWQNERELPIKGFLLFGGQRDYDVMPDGKRFVMVFPPRNEAGELERPRINVVVNWIEELKARVR
jgi:serine/threonine-protein kinase